MNERVTALVRKAHEALQLAHLAVEAELVDGALNRAYYAAFYAASAALLAKGETPRTHSGVHNRFWVRFVQTQQVPEDVSRILPHVFTLRQKADYDALSVFDVQAAEDLIADVERFVEAVEPLLSGPAHGEV